MHPREKILATPLLKSTHVISYGTKFRLQTNVVSGRWENCRVIAYEIRCRFARFDDYQFSCHCSSYMYRVAQKWHSFFWYAKTSSNINRFSKLFHCQNQEKMCNNTITKDPTTLQVCRYTTLWNVKCLQSNNWKQDDFCNNTFKKITTRNNLPQIFIVRTGIAEKVFKVRGQRSRS